MSHSMWLPVIVLDVDLGGAVRSVVVHRDRVGDRLSGDRGASRVVRLRDGDVGVADCERDRARQEEERAAEEEGECAWGVSLDC
jgi:hypothetical protein